MNDEEGKKKSQRTTKGEEKRFNKRGKNFRGYELKGKKRRDANDTG